MSGVETDVAYRTLETKYYMRFRFVSVGSNAMWNYYGWSRYVPVAQRRANAGKKLAKMRKKGLNVCPVEINGRTIAKSFWGKGWCDHMESFRDYENRLPRGRTYVRNGSVCHLEMSPGKIDAYVSGSELYKVGIEVKPLDRKRWKEIRGVCAGGVGSLLELLVGKISGNVMKIVSDRDSGLFPRAREMKFSCSCPDWASMCKHVAAVLYGVGARLDERPELLFLLRGVNPAELIDVRSVIAGSDAAPSGKRRTIGAGDLGEVFGIDIQEDAPVVVSVRGKRRKAAPAKPADSSARTPYPVADAARAVEESAMAAFRSAAQPGRMYEREEIMVEAAIFMGKVDVIHEIADQFEAWLSVAIERRVLRRENDFICAGPKSLCDYAPEDIAAHLAAARGFKPGAPVEDLFMPCAARLGFSKVGSKAVKLMRNILK